MMCPAPRPGLGITRAEQRGGEKLEQAWAQACEHFTNEPNL